MEVMLNLLVVIVVMDERKLNKVMGIGEGWSM